jgi:GT2 family glycosyltransferase
VDLVAVATADPDVLQEAERVASRAVLDLAALERDDLAWLRWQSAPPEVTVPSVSIIVPCHNGWALTEACLRTLGETLPEWFRGEIVVVDDKSTDETAQALKGLSREDGRVRVFRNRANHGFLASCNRGAAAARGDYLLFLNNDTVLLPGWLGPLLATFDARPDAGVVGGKLLFEDGRLQEAGGLVYVDASASKIGYLDPDVEAPFYQHIREVDYVSGAYLMTPRAVFEEVGGLDSRYGFGYYDDDDYCFAVRTTGRKVYFQPESVIVHVEGASAGTDLTQGLKRLQVTNRKIFRTKWKRALVHQPDMPDPLDGRSVVRAAVRGREQEHAT